MLGSIEDLEKDIELFRTNVAASNELCDLLSQVLSQIKQQSSDIKKETDDVLTKLDGIPSSIEAANKVSNTAIKDDVSNQLAQAIRDFSSEEEKYITTLTQVTQKIQLFIDQSKSQTSSFADNAESVISKVQDIPGIIDAHNAKSNSKLCADINEELQDALHSFAEEQNKYIRSLEQTRTIIQEYIERSKKQTQEFKHNTEEISEKLEQVCNQLKKDTKTSLDSHRESIDADIQKRNQQFSEKQQQFVTEMQESREKLNNCEEQFLSKYQDFLLTLDSTNLTKVYEQNQKLKSELNIKTTIIMVFSIISAILGFVSFFLK